MRRKLLRGARRGEGATALLLPPPSLLQGSAMTLDEYQADAVRTALVNDELPPLWYLALGLAGEAGEVANLIKKFERHGKAFSADAVADELGDVLWYLAVAAKAAGLTLDEVAAKNVDKLRARYPEGFKARG